MTVDLRVEIRIVVHFKLAVDLERFPTRPEIKTEAAQTPIDVVTLLFQHGQAVLARLAVDNRGILPFRLTAHIVHFQRQNRQAIEEIARSFRVQFCIGEGPGVVRRWPLRDRTAPMRAAAAELTT